MNSHSAWTLVTLSWCHRWVSFVIWNKQQWHTNEKATPSTCNGRYTWYKKGIKCFRLNSARFHLMPAFLAYHLRCRRRRKRPKICFPSAVLRGWRLWKPIVKHLVPQICQSDFERSTSFFDVKFRKDWWIYDISTSIKYLQVRYCWRFPFQTSVLSKHIDHVSGLPYKSNLRLEEWVTALFFLEAWLREVPVRRQNDDAKKAAAQALQQEAEELIVTWWSRFGMDRGT